MKIQVNDRRIQKTKNLLWESLVNLILEKGYDNVTIQDIIEKANVGRSTFYSHYESKENLLLSGQVHIFSSIFQEKDKSEMPNFEMLLKHGQQNIQLTKAILKINDNIKIVEHMHGFVSLKLMKYVKVQPANFSEIDILKVDLLVNSASSAIVNLILNWLKNDAVIPSNEIEEIINKVVRTLLFER